MRFKKLYGVLVVGSSVLGGVGCGGTDPEGKAGAMQVTADGGALPGDAATDGATTDAAAVDAGGTPCRVPCGAVCWG